VTATSVAPVSIASATTCAVCGTAATWQAGPDTRSCTRHLGDVLADLYAVEPHPFQPYLPTPLKRGNW
jgi:hypothetical protein